MMNLSRKRTDSAPIRSQHARRGQTLQHKPVILSVERAATGHRPQVFRDAIRGGVELVEVLLECERPHGRDLAEILQGTARLELRCDAELPFDDSATAR